MDERHEEPRKVGYIGYKLTPEIMDTICSHIEVGAPLTVACAAAGVPRVTYSVWMAALERGMTSEGRALTPEILEFGRRVEEAKGKFHTVNLHLMRNIALGGIKGNWLPCAWVLERTQKELYSLIPQQNKQEVEITVRAAISDAERLIGESEKPKRGRKRKPVEVDPDQ